MPTPLTASLTRAVSRRAGRGSGRRRIGALVGSVALVASLASASSATTPTSTTFVDAALVQMLVQAGWQTCPTSVSTANGDVVFHQATPTALGLIGLCSPSGVWWAWYQGDGNFVLYDTRTFTPTRTAASNGSLSLTLRADGNLVVTLADGATHSTGTAGIPGPVVLALGDDGNLTLTDATGARRWTSATAAGVPCPPPAATLMCGPWG